METLSEKQKKKEVKEAKKFLKNTLKELIYFEYVFELFKKEFTVDYDIEKVTNVQNKIKEVQQTILELRNSITQ